MLVVAIFWRLLYAANSLFPSNSWPSTWYEFICAQNAMLLCLDSWNCIRVMQWTLNVGSNLVAWMTLTSIYIQNLSIFISFIVHYYHYLLGIFIITLFKILQEKIGSCLQICTASSEHLSAMFIITAEL